MAFCLSIFAFPVCSLSSVSLCVMSALLVLGHFCYVSSGLSFLFGIQLCPGSGFLFPWGGPSIKGNYPLDPFDAKFCLTVLLLLLGWGLVSWFRFGLWMGEVCLPALRFCPRLIALLICPFGVVSLSRVYICFNLVLLFYWGSSAGILIAGWVLSMPRSLSWSCPSF